MITAILFVGGFLASIAAVAVVKFRIERRNRALYAELQKWRAGR